tara:strand:- start:744 stop:1016 length:273 start_codon:yes stop_codon:yes gene_type:complete
MQLCLLKDQVPLEVVDQIIDYVDYEKYEIIAQKKNFQNVLTDILDMNEFLKPISPWIAKQCWGSEAFNETQWNIDIEESIHPEEDEYIFD